MKAALRWASVGCFLVGLGALGCLFFFNNHLPPERALSYPLQSLRFHSKREIFVVASPRVPLSDLFDLSIFNNLQPGISVQEAQAILGPPQRTYQQFYGRDTVSVFPREDGFIEVIKQQVDSEGFKGNNWVLRWRPKGQRSEARLSPAILEILGGLPDTASIKVRSYDGVMAVELEDGLIRALVWLRRGSAEKFPLKLGPVIPPAETRVRKAS